MENQPKTSMSLKKYSMQTHCRHTSPMIEWVKEKKVGTDSSPETIAGTEDFHLGTENLELVMKEKALLGTEETVETEDFLAQTVGTEDFLAQKDTGGQTDPEREVNLLTEEGGNLLKRAEVQGTDRDLTQETETGLNLETEASLLEA